MQMCRTWWEWKLRGNKTDLGEAALFADFVKMVRDTVLNEVGDHTRCSHSEERALEGVAGFEFGFFAADHTVDAVAEIFHGADSSRVPAQCDVVADLQLVALYAFA